MLSKLTYLTSVNFVKCPNPSKIKRKITMVGKNTVEVKAMLQFQKYLSMEDKM